MTGGVDTHPRGAADGVLRPLSLDSGEREREAMRAARWETTWTLGGDRGRDDSAVIVVVDIVW